MRVKEMHPLCCISLESPAMGDQSPETRIKLSRSCSVADMRSDGNAAGLTRCGSESCSGSPIFAGVLYKWTNYGKGWRSRWFLLRNGVLSYSKILQLETLAGGEDVRLIGDVSSGRHKRVDRCGSSRRHKNQKTVGIVHLKVSSFRESRSDDRRFYIYTGTKTLDLRTSSKKDRGSWIECLGSTRNPLNLRRLNEISLSTERLKKRLVEEGSRVKDCEQMILLEFSQVKRQVQLLCEERSILLDTLRQLEAANIEGESSGGPEGDDQVTQQGKYSEWSRTDSSDDVSKEEGSEDEYLFVASDSLSDFKEKEASGSLRGREGVIKENVGKDLTRVCISMSRVLRIWSTVTFWTVLMNMEAVLRER